MADTAHSLTTLNFITIAILLTLIGSVIQGMFRGASGSARYLLLMLVEGIMAIISIYLTWKGVQLLSPLIQNWLKLQNLQIPAREIGMWKQMYYTIVTSIRDFPLLRFGVLFLIGYILIKQILYRLADPLLQKALAGSWGRSSDRKTFVSTAAGGLLGSIAGITRALILIAVLFIYVTLFPTQPLTKYIEASPLYQKGAKEVIAPFTGDFIADKVPVFTRAVEQEFSNILQRKYEVLDARISPDIAVAAKDVTASGQTDEEKAKLLYKWIGSRVKYDFEKVRLYEEKRIWKEQTPEDTFLTQKGVCIDYSRLYAVMARSINLDVKVVTGLGYDGQGSYGPHAWNEVYLKEKQRWVPLDSTWVASGGNWFNPPNFDQTHIKEA
jgi:transglutaminase-like putative cysteine protease